jgi:hypothetical protein
LDIGDFYPRCLSAEMEKGSATGHPEKFTPRPIHSIPGHQLLLLRQELLHYPPDTILLFRCEL